MKSKKETIANSSPNELEKKLAEVTFELERKNRDLEIEAALERVRTVAMGMSNPDDLLGICETMFHELKKLGFDDLRNAMISIHYDEKQYLLNYEYRESVGKTVIRVIYNSHPIVNNLVDHAKQSSEGFTEQVYAGEALDEWRAFRMGNGEADDPHLYNIGALYYYFYSIGTGAVGISMFSAANPGQLEVLKRFRNVFDLAYKRYIDITNAGAQAREAQIELALERVRARTMAMQKSDELKEIIKLVYEQLVHLNIPVEHAGFIMDYNTRDDMHIWLADKHYAPSEITVPYFDSPHWNGFNDAKQKGSNFFAIYSGFEEKNRFYQDLFKLIPGVTEETKEYYFSCPGLAISTVLLENVGLYIENFAGTPYSDDENGTLMRFGKVFQQTYTRFLDLQKAEAQVREAQIEAALEKVRSRSLAMHQTEELREVVTVVFDKLHDLGIVMEEEAASIVIFTEGTKDLILWNAIPDQLYSKSFHIPYYDTAVIKSLVDAKSEGADFFKRNYTPEEKDHFWKWAVEYSDYKNIPDDRKKHILERKYFACSVAYTKNSAILVSSYNGKLLSEKESEILKRFARVFEQAYVRFLDLHKAEEQAREAQIQLALERVRARTMAMQKSDELAETVSLLFRQLLGLGIRTEQIRTCGIVTFDDKKPIGEQWITETNGEIIPQSFMVPYDEAPAYKSIYKAWKHGEQFMVIHLEGNALKEHLSFLAKDTNVPTRDVVLPQQAKEIFNHVMYFSQGCLFIITKEALPEYHDVFKRFGAVFQQSYTRFLDLQKAEAQAREAQIEAALERVRSRTMAMQKSDELAEVIQVVHDQLHQLNFNIDVANFVLNYTESAICYKNTCPLF